MFCKLTAERMKRIHHFCSSKGIFQSVHKSPIFTLFLLFALFYSKECLCCFNEKTNVFSSRPVLLCDRYFHHYTEKPAKCFKGWCVLAFYRLTPCLSLFFIIYLVQSQRPKTRQESHGRNIPTTSLSVPLLHEEMK